MFEHEISVVSTLRKKIELAYIGTDQMKMKEALRLGSFLSFVRISI